MYRYNRPKQCSECVGSLRSAMLEKLRPAPLLGTEANVSLRRPVPVPVPVPVLVEKGRVGSP